MPNLTNITALGFVLENGHLFNWSGGNFRLAEDAISVLDDFSRTGLAGRIAQGMAVLYMENQGYVFADRFSAFCQRNNVPITKTSGKKVLKQKTPDFVFEKIPTERVLVESKGGFVAAGNIAVIKGELAAALDQLKPWGGQFNPPIIKKYAVGTFLREINDPHVEESLLAVVDPVGKQDDETHDVPNGSVRQANYAAWLLGMGYESASQRMLAPVREGALLARFEVAEFLGRQFAIVPLGLIPAYDLSKPAAVDGLRHWLFDPVYDIRRLARHGGYQLAVAAIDFEILKRVAESSAQQNWDSLLEIPLTRSRDEINALRNGGPLGSSFADGTFVGPISLDRLLQSSFRTEMLGF